jgi:hypothetical protein
MKEPAQLKSLDDLMAQAAHYANFCLRNSGSMPPTLFLIGESSPMMFLPGKMASETEKDSFANMARLVCIAHDATCCVMTMEAWMKTAKPDQPLDMTEPPSEAFDREEVVVLMGEDRAGQRQQFLPIIRSGNGKFFNLGESTLPVMDNIEGRFAQILSPKIPDAQAKLLAQTMLKVKQAKMIKLGNQGRLRR